MFIFFFILVNFIQWLIWTTSLLSVKIEFNPFAASTSKLKPIASLLPPPWKYILYDALKIFNNSFLSFQSHALLGRLRTHNSNIIFDKVIRSNSSNSPMNWASLATTVQGNSSNLVHWCPVLPKVAPLPSSWVTRCVLPAYVVFQ